MRQKGILLGFIEPVNFVDEQRGRPAYRPTMLRSLNNLPQLGNAAGDG